MLPPVDKKLFFSTFAAIFIAEMGDKTQLATLSLAGSATSARWVVFAASALALVSTSAIAVLAGELVSRYIPPIWLKRAAGVVFLVLGAIYLWGARGPAGTTSS
jgi:putative Ca2+/H+ antiporter (TMEM165/GDT1 family)